MMHDVARSRSRTASRLFVTGSLAMCLLSCGGKDKTEVSEPAPPPRNSDQTGQQGRSPLVSPQTTPTPFPSAQARGHWSASDTSLELRHHDASGKHTDTCNLASAEAFAHITTGGVSALTFIDKSTLLAVVDPGSEGEHIALVDVSKSPCQASVWYGPSPSFTNVSATSIAPFSAPNSEYLRVFVGRPNGADRFTWAQGAPATRASGPGDAPFVTAAPAGPGNCLAGTITAMAVLGEGDARALLLLSKGEGTTRLNVVGSLMGGAGGNPQCLSSHDYGGSGVPTTATDVPVQAIQASDKRVYVLYQNAQLGGKVVRYDFNGMMLMSPFVISQDPDDVGYQPRALANPAPGQLLLATGQFLTTIDASSGRLVRRTSDGVWTPRVTSIVVDP